MASGAKTHDAHYLLQVWLCPIFSAPKIDPWVQVLSASSIHYIDSFPTSLSLIVLAAFADHCLDPLEEEEKTFSYHLSRIIYFYFIEVFLN